MLPVIVVFSRTSGSYKYAYTRPESSTALPEEYPNGITLVTVTSGFSYGANDTNNAWFGLASLCWAVPVLPATATLI